jgi:hypothetical protein
VPFSSYTKLGFVLPICIILHLSMLNLICHLHAQPHRLSTPQPWNPRYIQMNLDVSGYRYIRIYPDTSGIYPDVFGIHPNISRYIQDISGYIRIHPNISGYIRDVSGYIRIYLGCIYIRIHLDYCLSVTMSLLLLQCHHIIAETL